MWIYPKEDFSLKNKYAFYMRKTAYDYDKQVLSLSF